MRLLAILAVAFVLPGCTSTGGGGDDGPWVGQSAECSAAVKESAKPDGMPFGSFDHYLTNELGRPVSVLVEHMHRSGCALNAVRDQLADGETLTLEYRDDLWETSSRVVRFDDTEAAGGIDWACSWHFAMTPGGLQDAEEAHMCA